MEQRPVVIVAAKRTPMGRFMGAFADVPAVDLGIAAARAALDAAGLDPGEVQETVAGHGRQAGNGPNPGRQVSVRAGVPDTVPAYTVNKACGSSAKALTLAAGSIILEELEVALVVGMENMTRTPYLLRGLRGGYRMGPATVEDGMSADGFMDPLAGEAMGETAENLAERYAVTREEQDAFALQSQRRAAEAWEAGRFADEVVAVDTFDARRRTVTVERDEHLRPDTTLDGLARLRPVFRRPGTVTAGNSSGICDGAAALVVMAEAAALARGIRPLARVVGWASAGVDPHVMGWGVVPATQKLLARLGWSLPEIDVVEVNEAFAAQVLACDRELKFDWERTNLNGGAIALGHPIGMTGARIVGSVVHQLQRSGGRRGLATLCISGGQGMAVAVERVGA
ncbi:MAG TPA: thiolase family protein [Actinomycetes bacterium]|jgi:acetyl-CoA C-acetyltransferase|nr:thiolase family protein [Actinomycetes bacterium]